MWCCSFADHKFCFVDEHHNSLRIIIETGARVQLPPIRQPAALDAEERPAQKEQREEFGERHLHAAVRCTHGRPGHHQTVTFASVFSDVSNNWVWNVGIYAVHCKHIYCLVLLNFIDDYVYMCVHVHTCTCAYMYVILQSYFYRSILNTFMLQGRVSMK